MSTEAGTEAGAGIDLQVSLVAAIGGLTQALKQEAHWRRRQMEVIRQVPIVTGQLTSGIAYDQPDQLQAKTGFMWSVRRLTCQGFTAGTVTTYRNSTAGEVIAPFPNAASFTYGRGEILLNPGDKMIFLAAGLTGTAQVYGSADCFEEWYLPFYLG